LEQPVSVAAPAGVGSLIETRVPAGGRLPLLSDASAERRITAIWGLLFFNVLGTPGSILNVPRPVLQVLTMSALGLALLLVLMLNPRLLIRPNLVLTLATVLAGAALMTSLRGEVGPGGVIRSVRLFVFLAVLWLLTPWWDRRGLLLARCHLRALVAISLSVVVGLLLFPSMALGGHTTDRLRGVLWSIPAPQVAEYAALMAGMAVVLWLSGSMGRKAAFVLGGGGLAMVLATRTRTALVALVLGLVCAGLTLFLSRQRVRRVATILLIVTPLAAAAFAPPVADWFQREQSEEQLRDLTGRKQIWAGVISQERPEFNRWFGWGLSNKSFNGNPIDGTWLAVFHDQGLFGVVIVAIILLSLLLAVGFSRAGPERALATLLVVYCMVASYTEVGLGDASPYLLHVVVAASSLTTASTHRQEPAVAVGAVPPESQPLSPVAAG
jgi:hypothetical protein